MRMNSFMAELVGTMLLILLGDGVVAAVVLNKSKAENSGWMVITTGWAMAVAMGVYAAGRISGAHMNPAVTLGLAAIGKFSWSAVPRYLAAQFLGAFLGAVVVWLAYLAHWPVTEDQGAKLGVFSTAPAIRQLAHESAHRNHRNVCPDVWRARHRGQHCSCAKRPHSASDRISRLVDRAVARGRPPDYAMNPARDLGPRLAHALLPIAGKGGSDWGYSWVPIVGPVIGGLLGAVAYVRIFGS